MSSADCQQLVLQLAQFGVTTKGSELFGCSPEDLPNLIDLYTTYVNFLASFKTLQKETVHAAEFATFTESIASTNAAIKARQLQFKHFSTYTEFGKHLDKIAGTAQLAEKIKTATFHENHWKTWQEDVGDSVVGLGPDSSVATLWQAIDIQKNPQFLPLLITKAATERIARAKIVDIKNTFGQLKIVCEGSGVLLVELGARELTTMDEALASLHSFRAMESMQADAQEVINTLQITRQCLFQGVECTTTMNALVPIMGNPMVATALPAAEKLDRGLDRIDSPAVGSGLCVHSPFQSNLVGQRDHPIPIRGWAAPCESVSVFIGD